jgi:hypothetical protein
MFLGSKARPARKANNHTTISEPIVETITAGLIKLRNEELLLIAKCNYNELLGLHNMLGNS